MVRLEFSPFSEGDGEGLVLVKWMNMAGKLGADVKGIVIMKFCM